jgi:hypothetical protein
MADVMEIVKKHPVPIALAGIGLVAIIALRGSGAGTSAASSAAAIDAQNNQTNLQLAGIDAQVQGAQITAQAQMNQVNEEAATQQYETSAALAASNNQNLMQTALGLLSYNANVQQTNAQLALGQTEVAANVQENASNNQVLMQRLSDSLTQELSPQFANLYTIAEQPSIINANANLATAQANATATNVNSGINAAGAAAGLLTSFGF